MPFIAYAQNYEDLMLWRCLQDIKQGFYIDVGAAWPISDSVTCAFYERGWRGINIEPNPALLAQLKQERPRDINLACAITNEPGPITLTVFDNPGLSTGIAAIAQQHQRQGKSGQNLQVETQTMREIWIHYVGPNQPVHFLKIDAEGSL